MPSFSLTEILHGCYASPWSSRSCFCVLCGVLRCLCNWPFWRFVGAVVANQIEVVCFECNPPICHRDQNSWGFSLCFCCLLYICLPCLLYLQLLGHRALCQQRKGESGLVHFFWFPALVFGFNKSKYGSLLSRSKMRHDLCWHGLTRLFFPPFNNTLSPSGTPKAYPRVSDLISDIPSNLGPSIYKPVQKKKLLVLSLPHWPFD